METSRKERHMNGDVRYHKDGCKASYGNQALSIETALGSLVVYANGDPGIFVEIGRAHV